MLGGRIRRAVRGAAVHGTRAQHTDTTADGGGAAREEEARPTQADTWRIDIQSLTSCTKYSFPGQKLNCLIKKDLV